MSTGVIRQHIDALNEALGFRRYLLAPLVGAVIGFADWVFLRLEANGVSSFFGVSPIVIGILAALISLAYFLVDHIVTLRKRLTPLLSVDYDDKAQDCHKTIEIGPTPRRFGRSLRLRVTCKSDVNVEQCSGFLTRIEYRAHGGQFSDEPLYEPTYLDWSLSDPQFSPVTVYPNVPRYLAVCRTDEHLSGFFSRTKHRSFVTPELFDKIGEYRLHVEIVGAHATTISRVLMVTWNGKWSEIRACLLQPAQKPH